MSTPVPSLFDMHRAARDLTDAEPAEVLLWAADQFGDGLVVTASFGDAILVHLAATTVPGIEIVLLDTGYLFAETKWYAETLRSRFDLRLTIVEPHTDPSDDDRWMFDPDGCCRVRKVEPLNRVLEGRSGWVNGVRRADGPTRANTPVVAFDVERNIVKINPIVSLSDDDVEEYHRRHDLPRHPLTDRGYSSIGCWPCTRPVLPGEDPRAGRWADSDKTECGLHL